MDSLNSLSLSRAKTCGTSRTYSSPSRPLPWNRCEVASRIVTPARDSKLRFFRRVAGFYRWDVFQRTDLQPLRSIPVEGTRPGPTATGLPGRTVARRGQFLVGTVRPLRDGTVGIVRDVGSAVVCHSRCNTGDGGFHCRSLLLRNRLAVVHVVPR